MNAPQALNVLVVEDEPKLAALLQDYLKAAGFGVQWIANGNEAMSAIRADTPDFILLDLMLPGRDGLEICREVRTFSQVPVIMLTARVDEIDRLLGLGIGADDYICKPFSPREVIARIHAVLRRTQRDTNASSGTRLLIDSATHQASFDGTKLELTPVEFRLLATLATGPGRVFSRDQLLDHLYEDHRVVTDRTVDTHIKNVRRKLEACSPGYDVIESIYGVGYRLNTLH